MSLEIRVNSEQEMQVLDRMIVLKHNLKYSIFNNVQIAAQPKAVRSYHLFCQTPNSDWNEDTQSHSTLLDISHWLLSG